MDCSPPDSSIHGIPQARVPEVGSHPPVQGILSTPGWNLVSCIAGWFFTIRATGGSPVNTEHLYCWSCSWCQLSHCSHHWTQGRQGAKAKRLEEDTRSAGTAAAAAESSQSCLTLCDPIDGSPPASPVPGILQARTLEWAAISFSNAWKWKVKVKSLSRVLLVTTPWTAAHQALPSMGCSRQEYWSENPNSWPYICHPRENSLDFSLLFLKSSQNYHAW